MGISFFVTAYNEYEDLKRLLGQLTQVVKHSDELVIQLDSKATVEVITLVDEFIAKNKDSMLIKKTHFDLNGDFASFKNNGKSYCTKEWIFQIDADETLSETFGTVIHQVLETNEEIDLMSVPRVNIVKGLEQNDVIRWGWQLNNQGWVNWPDYQARIYRITDDITWGNAVHETLTGYNTFSNFPMEEDWALYHPKDIKRQESQNEFYDTL